MKGFGFLGASLFLLALFLVAITLATGLSWFRLMDAIGRGLLAGARLARRDSCASADDWSAARAGARRARESCARSRQCGSPSASRSGSSRCLRRSKKATRAYRETQIPLFSGASREGELPPLSLLDEPKLQAKGYSEETLEALSRQVELKLKDFRIEARGRQRASGSGHHALRNAAGARHQGQPDIEPRQGHRARTVGGQRARRRRDSRQVGDRPGDSELAIARSVYLSEILSSGKYDALKSPLALALGKDIGGAPVVVDLAKMPHLLVAGTTGSGKSVALNAMVLSLLYKASRAATCA